jgi:hypothetical protein
MAQTALRKLPKSPKPRRELVMSPLVLSLDRRRTIKPRYLVKLDGAWRLADGPYKGQTLEAVLDYHAEHVYDIARDLFIRRPEKRVLDAAIAAHEASFAKWLYDSRSSSTGPYRGV